MRSDFSLKFLRGVQYGNKAFMHQVHETGKVVIVHGSLEPAKRNQCAY